MITDANMVTEARNIITEQTSDIVRHVEIKAYLDRYQTLCERVAALADSPPIDRVQHDTFYHCRSGRLKLRSSGQLHDLIYYRRKDDYGPTESFYQVARAKNPIALRASLNSAFGEAGRVKKFRRSYKIGNSFVHLDRVGGLGDFLEIKTELGGSSTACHGLTPETGIDIVESLMTTLEIDLFQLVDGAYIDLINERGAGKRSGSPGPNA